MIEYRRVNISNKKLLSPGKDKSPTFKVEGKSPVELIKKKADGHLKVSKQKQISEKEGNAP